jgi:hypothetical protein
MNFGGEEEADQYLQVLNSKDIKDLINHKYGLMKLYGLDSLKTKNAITKYYDWFDDNFSFRRTEYVSIVIEVLDHNPKLAAAMANDIAAFADTLIDRMQKFRARQAFDIAKTEYFHLDSIINAQEDSVDKLRALGALNYEDQSLYLGKQYYKALMKGKTDIANTISKQLVTVRKYAKKMGELQNTITFERLQISALLYKYTEAKIELEQRLPHKYIVESARVSEKKAYPKKALIVLTSTASAVFMMFVLLLIFDSFKKNL